MDTDDTLKWIKKAKKREKELAKRRMEELENMDKQFQGDEYTESTWSPSLVVLDCLLMCNSLEDLEGLKVAHDLEELKEGEDRILTLKDSRILDNEGGFLFDFDLSTADCYRVEDELMNVEMAESERVKKINELKIKKKDYRGYDDEEFSEGQAGVRRSILAKYDEDLEGSKETVRTAVVFLAAPS